MAKMVLRCTRCGQVDSQRQFENANEAQSTLAHWACSRCAWTDYELVDAESADRPAEVGAAKG